MVPLDADHVHQSVDTHRVCGARRQKSTSLPGDVSWERNPENASRSFLTLVVLVAHDLTASVVEADGQTGAVRLHVAPAACVPVDACYADGSSHVGEAADGHLHLKHNVSICADTVC